MRCKATAVNLMETGTMDEQACSWATPEVFLETEED